MTVKELIEKLQEFPEGAVVTLNGWSFSELDVDDKLLTNYSFELFERTQYKELCMTFEEPYDSYDEYHECPDCGKDFT